MMRYRSCAAAILASAQARRESAARLPGLGSPELLGGDMLEGFNATKLATNSLKFSNGS